MKIDIYYKDSKEQNHFLLSTLGYDTLKSAYLSAKLTLMKPSNNRIYSKIVGEKIAVSRLFAVRDKYVK